MTAIFNSAAAPKSYEFKVVLLGDRGVGKTCLVLRFIEGLYNARQQSTIGAFFLTKKIKTARGDDCKIQIWDTAGQERFRSMAPLYYRGAVAAILHRRLASHDHVDDVRCDRFRVGVGLHRLNDLGLQAAAAAVGASRHVVILSQFTRT